MSQLSKALGVNFFESRAYPPEPRGLGNILKPAGDGGASDLLRMLQGLRARGDSMGGRASGAAASLASAVLECCVPQSSAHVLLFAAGPATLGPGASVGESGYQFFQFLVVFLQFLAYFMHWIGGRL